MFVNSEVHSVWRSKYVWSRAYLYTFFRREIKREGGNINTVTCYNLYMKHKGKMTIHRYAWIMNVFPRDVIFILLLFFLFWFPCNFRTIALSFRKKLSLWQRGNVNQTKPRYFLAFPATYVQHKNYRSRKGESVLYYHLRSEVRILLRLLFYCAFYFFRIL